MLAVLSWTCPAAFLSPSAAIPSAPILHRAPGIRCSTLEIPGPGGPDSGRQQLFDEYFTKGGMAVQEGDIPRALGYFKEALSIDPTNQQTMKMDVIMPISPDGVVDVSAAGESE